MSFLDSFKPQESVPTLDVPAAGAKAVVGEGKTADCLKFEDPLPTPHEVKKYRKSFYGEPGARVQHPALSMTPLLCGSSSTQPRLGRPPRSNMYVKDVMAHGPQTKMADYLNERKESIYKSRKNEVLGNTNIWLEFLLGARQTFAFEGPSTKVKDEGTCKELLYPEQPAISVAEQERAKNLYRISHGSYEAGEQRRDGKANTASMCHRLRLVDKQGRRTVSAMLCHGMTSEAIAAQTASRGSVLHIVPKQLEKFKEQNDDVIGRKNLGQAEEIGRGRSLPMA